MYALGTFIVYSIRFSILHLILGSRHGSSVEQCSACAHLPGSILGVQGTQRHVLETIPSQTRDFFSELIYTSKMCPKRGLMFDHVWSINDDEMRMSWMAYKTWWCRPRGSEAGSEEFCTRSDWVSLILPFWSCQFKENNYIKPRHLKLSNLSSKKSEVYGTRMGLVKLVKVHNLGHAGANPADRIHSGVQKRWKRIMRKIILSPVMITSKIWC